MVALQEQKERVGTLLQAAVPMMCRNGLQFTSNFEITALIGIKIDTETFLVSINDTFRTENDEESQEAKDKNSCSESENSAGPSSPKRAKRKRKRSKNMSDKKARQAEEDRSSSESDNEAGPSPAASSRLEAQPVLALEETSLDTAYELNQTIADNQSRKPTASAKVKQENQSGSDSDDLVLVKEENMYNYGNHGDSVGGAEGGFPGGLGNTLQQASTSFGLPPQFHHTNTNSSDLQGDQLMDVSGSHLSQQDPQQVSGAGGTSQAPPQAPQVSHLLTTDMKLKAAGLQATYSIPIGEYFTQLTDQTTGATIFQCRICHKPASRANRRRHLNDTHAAATFNCYQCGAMYRSKTTLRQHIRNFHPTESTSMSSSLAQSAMEDNNKDTGNQTLDKTPPKNTSSNDKNFDRNFHGLASETSSRSEHQIENSYNVPLQLPMERSNPTQLPSLDAIRSLVPPPDPSVSLDSSNSNFDFSSPPKPSHATDPSMNTDGSGNTSNTQYSSLPVYPSFEQTQSFNAPTHSAWNIENVKGIDESDYKKELDEIMGRNEGDAGNK